MRCSEVCARLDDRLDTAAYADVDASANGLQVGPGDAAVEHVAFAVDAAVATVEAAAEAGADLLVTHHGYSWGGFERVTDRLHERLRPHFDHDLPLYVSHLPLDGHPTLGNAAGLADLLGLEDRAPFGELDGEHVGRRGTAPDPYGTDELRELLERELPHGGQGVRALEFGPAAVADVAIVTGSGTDWLDEAVAAGADALVTGEGKAQVYHEAREAGITVYLAGHYATEVFGVRNLRDLAAEWGLETTVLEHPTGL